MIEKYRLTKGSLRNLINLILDIFDKGEEVLSVEVKKWQDPATGAMRRTFWKWMEETAEEMAKRGVVRPIINSKGKTLFNRPITKEDCYELFMSRWGGVGDKGDRASLSNSKSKKGEMLHIMNSHLAWCTEQGIALTIPRDCEFSRLNKEMDE